jgi:thiol-disulfide isomerase/thioredoxin
VITSAVAGAAVVWVLTMASAQDEQSAEAQMRAALEVAKEDVPKAIGMLEKALKDHPDDRRLTYLHAAMCCVRGEEAGDKAERIALFHKSTAGFNQLREKFPDLNGPERTFLARSRVGEARALALEGKPAEALAAVGDSLADHPENLDALDEEKDLEAVRKLPEFKATVDRALRAGVAEELKQARSYPFDFELKDTDDNNVALADYKGKVTIVDLWGTWCAPCRQEIPHFVEIYKEYHPKGLEIVGINCNEKGSFGEIKSKIKEFTKSNNVPYKCLLNDDMTEAKIPGFQGYPTTLFLDRDGRVRLTLVGYTPRARLEAIVGTLLAEPERAGSR